MLLYVVYTCQKSFTYINAFDVTSKNVSWPRLNGLPCIWGIHTFAQTVRFLLHFFWSRDLDFGPQSIGAICKAGFNNLFWQFHGCSHLFLVVLTQKQNKKLSYRKQIARKLRTQYIEGIYSNSVTLKSRLEVIQSHWKWHHSIDSIRVPISVR